MALVRLYQIYFMHINDFFQKQALYSINVNVNLNINQFTVQGAINLMSL